MHGEYKVPGGKLVVVDVEEKDGTLHNVQVSGDFFLEPDEALDRITGALEGAPADSDAAHLAARISREVLPTDTLFGLTPEGVGIAVRRALGNALSWEDIDFETKLWEIPAEVMKMKRPHIVPLSEQVIMLFKQLEPISKHHPLVFIGRNDPRKPISKESINQVIELLGYKGRLTGHGFRHTMSTILHEQGFNSAWIEMQLAHVDKNSIRGTYNHALYLDGRREMMQWYADYIDSLSSRES